MSWLYKSKADADIFTLCVQIRKEVKSKILREVYVKHENKIFDALPQVVPLYHDYIMATKIIERLNDRLVFTESQFEWLVSHKQDICDWFEIYHTVSEE